jgi:hypothetical protein
MEVSETCFVEQSLNRLELNLIVDTRVMMTNVVALICHQMYFLTSCVQIVVHHHVFLRIADRF